MDNIEQKLEEIEALIKSNLMPKMSQPILMPSLDQPASPGRPRGPGVTRTNPVPKTASGVSPTSKKNPLKVAEQLKNPELKQEVKNNIKFNSKGQWSL